MTLPDAPPAPAADPPPTTAALPLAAAVVSGAFVALQQRINGDLGHDLGDPLVAAVVSFGTGLVVMCLLMLRGAPRAVLPRLSQVPWWSRLGGLGGASLVFVGAVAAPKVGVAILTVGLVSGSVVGALLVDRVGLGPGGHHGLTPPRLIGAALCLVAIAVSTAEGARSASLWLLALVFLAGVLICFQQAFNGRVRHATDATVATFVNFVVGMTALLLGLLIRAVVVGVHLRSWPGADHWYLYVGGPIGASFVAVAALVVRRLGVLRLGLAVTAGQILGSLVVDLDRGIAASTVVAAVLTMAAVVVSGLGQRA
ncbi:MAG: family transporter [Frankiales bacterium]|nr:family transporter [Frankiales bacterium]